MSFWSLVKSTEKRFGRGRDTGFEWFNGSLGRCTKQWVSDLSLMSTLAYQLDESNKRVLVMSKRSETRVVRLRFEGIHCIL